MFWGREMIWYLSPEKEEYGKNFENHCIRLIKTYFVVVLILKFHQNFPEFHVGSHRFKSDLGAFKLCKSNFQPLSCLKICFKTIVFSVINFVLLSEEHIDKLQSLLKQGKINLIKLATIKH